MLIKRGVDRIVADPRLRFPYTLWLLLRRGHRYRRYTFQANGAWWACRPVGYE